jgi:hypothetical protein
MIPYYIISESQESKLGGETNKFGTCTNGRILQQRCLPHVKDAVQGETGLRTTRKNVK